MINKKDIALNVPLVSITIPTLNEESTLPITLKSIKNQTYNEIEIIVVDSNSSDRTKEIAIEYDTNFIRYDGKLLGARYLGAKMSKGEYIFLLDADQVLEPTVIERAINEIKDCDMLIMEESSYNPTTWIQKQIAREREHSHRDARNNTIVGSGLLPRFFRSELLLQIFKNIPDELLPIVRAQDHAIITEEAFKISNKVKILSNAVSHIEERSIIELFKHLYSLGKSTKELSNMGLYKDILSPPPPNIKKINRVITSRSIMLAIINSTAFRLGQILG